MTPEQRLALLFRLWTERVKQTGAAQFDNDLEYSEACAAYLIELDTETDGKKLFPSASRQV